MYGMRLDTNEKRQEARKIYLKSCSMVQEYPEVNAVIGTYEQAGKFLAMGFKGTQGKPDFHYSFSTEARRGKYIQEFLEGCKRNQAYKAEQKEKNKGVLTGAAACAAAIRQELKEKYPGVKFSVTSENFAGGNSVSVDWTDGPEYTEIESIVDGYQYGYFDGMTDCYEFKKDRDPNKPMAKYTHTNKHYSESATQALKDKVNELDIPGYCTNNYGEFRPQLAERVIKEELQRREEEQQEPENIIVVDFQNRKRA
jgi:hypothetical protein